MDAIKKFSWPLTIAICLHIVIFLIVVISFNSKPSVVQPKPAPEIIQATVLDEDLVQGEVERLKQLEEDKRKAEENRQKQLEEKRLQEERKLQELQEKRRLEEQKAKEEDIQRKKKAEEEQKKLAEIKKQKELEAARLEKIKKQKALEEQKRLEAQRKKEAEEKNRKAEEKRKQEAEAKRKREAEAKRKREAEALRKAEEQRQAELKRQADEARRIAELEGRAQVAIANAKRLIEQKVNRNWIRPSSVEAGLSCVIRVKLVPGGGVMSAVVTKSSGNTIFDRSAENAVRKASPLPVPSEPYIFNKFRSFSFIFKPPYG